MPHAVSTLAAAAAAAADARRADALGLAALLLDAGQALGAARHAAVQRLEVEHVRDVPLLTPIPLVVLSIQAIAARGLTPPPKTTPIFNLKPLQLLSGALNELDFLAAGLTYRGLHASDAAE